MVVFMVSVVAGKRFLMVSVVSCFTVSAVAGNVLLCFPSLVVKWFPAATGPRLRLRWKQLKKHRDVSVTN